MRTILASALSLSENRLPKKGTLARGTLNQAEKAIQQSISPLERIEIMILPWVGFVVMPLFALSNAGVEVSLTGAISPLALGISVALAVGKPIGVITFSWLALRTGLTSFPGDLRWPYVLAGAALTGIGFTMSLFIAGLAFADISLGEAKIGILVGSAISGAIGLLGLVAVTRLRDRDPKADPKHEECRHS